MKEKLDVKISFKLQIVETDTHN